MTNTSIPIDVLFAIALPEEMAGIQPRLPEGTIPQTVDKWTIHYITDSYAQNDIRLGFWIQHEMGNEEIILRLPSVIKATNPKFIVNVGIAGMLSGDARIGDVVIVTDIDHYSFRGAIDDAEMLDEALRLGGKPVPCDTDTWKAARKYNECNKDFWGSIAQRSDSTGTLKHADKTKLLNQRLVNSPIQLHFGPICSGPFVSRSKSFKKRLLDRDRNRLCIEMEAAGVGMVMNEHFPTCPFLIVKGVSDPGDENKSAIDKAFNGNHRRWAIQNAFDTAIGIVRERFRLQFPEMNIDHNSGLEAKIRTNIKHYFLPQPYGQLADELTSAPQGLYSELSEVVAMAPCSPGLSPVEYLSSILDNNISKRSIYITGRSGTGKTTLLSLLYLHSLQKWHDSNNVMPILIGIRPSLGFWNENRNEVGQEQQISRITEMLSDIQKYAQQHPKVSLLLLLDSGEGESAFVNHTRKEVRRLAKTIRAGVIITGRETHIQFGEPPDQHFRLQPRKRDKITLSIFCAAYTKLVRMERNDEFSKRLQKLLWSANLEDVDLFDASMGLQLLNAEDTDGFRHEATVMEDYSVLRLRQLGVPEEAVSDVITDAARHALAQERGQANDASLEKLDHPRRALVRAHPRIHDFLVARCLISDLRSFTPQKSMPASLDCVYPERINRFAKGIMCSANFEEQCISNAIRLIKAPKASYRSKAFVAYLIGRASKPQLKDHARNELGPLIKELRDFHKYAEDSTDDHEALLYVRTVFITLSYLGNKAVKREYVALLINDKRLDEINRGFHLEYYGDQKYEVSLPLQNMDRLEDCPLTIERLFARLCAEQKPPLFEIELQTFCSLGVQRHAAGVLSVDFKEKLLFVLADERIREAIKFPELNDYLAAVDLCLAEECLCAGAIVDKFVRERDEKRKGWIIRGITACESVADHVLATVRLAQLYLPETTDIPGYDKERVLRMLWIHDWGESIIGDFLPNQKGEVVQEKEMLVFRQLSNIGMVPGLSNQKEALNLFQEFEAEQSINSKIARDIDRLEMLTQVYRYFDQGKLAKSKLDVTKELAKMIQTPIGYEILDRINEWRRRKQSVQSKKMKLSSPAH